MNPPDPESRTDTSVSGMRPDPPVLVGGPPSCGSTLFSTMLDAHPYMCCGPEMNFLSHPVFWKAQGEEWRSAMRIMLQPPDERPDRWTLIMRGYSPYQSINWNNIGWYGWSKSQLAEIIEACDDGPSFLADFCDPVLAKQNVRRWAEKSPPNLYAIPAFLNRYPESRSIVMVRDGRDVVASLKRRGFPVGYAGAVWLIETAMTVGVSQHDHVLLIKYEDLIHNTAQTLDRVQDFLDLPRSTDQMLQYRKFSERIACDESLDVQTWKVTPREDISLKAIGTWRDELDRSELCLLEGLRIEPRRTFSCAYPPLADYESYTFGRLLEQLEYGSTEADCLGEDANAMLRLLWEEGSVIEQLASPKRFHLAHTCSETVESFDPNTSANVLRLAGCIRSEMNVRLKDQQQELARLDRNLTAVRNQLVVRYDALRDEVRRLHSPIVKQIEQLQSKLREMERRKTERRLSFRIRRIVKRLINRGDR